MLDKMIDFIVFAYRVPYSVDDLSQTMKEIKAEVKTVREHQIMVKTLVENCPYCTRHMSESL